jgi:tellurite resistance protein
MTSLSPAAQAVLDAAIKVAESPDAEAIAAAALRAAADQARDNPWPGRIESVGVMWMHDGLLAIAAELEAFSNE